MIFNAEVEEDGGLSEEVLQLSELFSEIKWVTRDSISEICKDHTMAFRKGLAILTSGDVRNVWCRPHKDFQKRVHAYVHSEYKANWYVTNIFIHPTIEEWSWSSVCQHTYVPFIESVVNSNCFDSKLLKVLIFVFMLLPYYSALWFTEITFMMRLVPHG
jgi:hypothetical protein